jgi:hypothetical protein
LAVVLSLTREEGMLLGEVNRGGGVRNLMRSNSIDSKETSEVLDTNKGDEEKNNYIRRS